MANDKIVKSVHTAIENVRYDMPDGKYKQEAYTKLQEALLWIEASSSKVLEK